MQRIILIGRHAPDFGRQADEYEVVAQEDVTWPATIQECIPLLNRLINDALAQKASVVFQNIPGQLAATLAYTCRIDGEMRDWPYGVVISKPGPRPAGETHEFWGTDAWDACTLMDAVKFTNPRAKTEALGCGIRVTVDPPMVFEFSHIEWF